jgi:hypothetical protein
MKAIEKIVAKNDGERIWKRVAELELENCKLIVTAVEAADDYEVLQLGNSSLLGELSLSM